MPKLSSAAALSGLIFAMPLLSHAECPTIGVPITAQQSGEVIATMLAPDNTDVRYIDTLYVGDTLIFDQSTPVGTKKSLGFFNAGDEVTFRLHVVTTSGVERDFYSGNETRNEDGKPHALLKSLPTGDIEVNFEDITGIAECPDGAGAFTDFKFSLSNVQSILSPDRFLSYKAKPTSVGRKRVTLTDLLGTFSVTATRKATLSNPVDIGATVRQSPEISLAGYTVTGASRKATFAVNNELGSWRIATSKPERLLLPTTTERSPNPALPVLANQGIVDPYVCYKSKVVSGAKTLNSKPLLQDELNTAARRYTISKPNRLCIPADGGEGIKRPETYLMCYAATPAGKPRKVKGIYTNNASFGQSRTNVIKEEEYCVPSTASRQ